MAKSTSSANSGKSRGRRGQTERAGAGRNEGRANAHDVVIEGFGTARPSPTRAAKTGKAGKGATPAIPSTTARASVARKAGGGTEVAITKARGVVLSEGERAAFAFAADLPRKASSHLKTEGWSRFVRQAEQTGALLVTSRDQPDAVLVTPQRYAALVAAAEREEQRRRQVLDELNARFDERMQALNSSAVARRVDSFMDTPVQLRGRVRAGQTY